MLLGKRKDLYSHCLRTGESLDSFIQKTCDLISSFEDGRAILIFVDLQGGTPWNAVLGINNTHVHLVTGINLPMLLEVLCLRDHSNNIDELVTCAVETGKASILSKQFTFKERNNE